MAISHDCLPWSAARRGSEPPALQQLQANRAEKVLVCLQAASLHPLTSSTCKAQCVRGCLRPSSCPWAPPAPRAAAARGAALSTTPSSCSGSLGATEIPIPVFLGSAAVAEPDERRRGVVMIFFARRQGNISKHHSISVSFVSSRELQTHGDGAESPGLCQLHTSHPGIVRGPPTSPASCGPRQLSTFPRLSGCSPAACRSGLCFMGCSCSLSLDLINFSRITCSLSVPEATAG